MDIYLRLKGNKRWYKEASVGEDMDNIFALWTSLEEKYLPSYVGYKGDEKDERTLQCEQENKYNHRLDYWVYDENREPMREITALANDFRMSYAETMALRTTLDDTMVIAEDLPLLVEIFDEIGNEHGAIHKETAIAVARLMVRFGKRLRAITFNPIEDMPNATTYNQKFCRPLTSFKDCLIVKEDYERIREEKYGEARQ